MAAATLDGSLGETGLTHIATAGVDPLEDGVVARLHRCGNSYEGEALADR